MNKTSQFEIPQGIITLYPTPVQNIIDTDLRSIAMKEVLLPRPPNRLVAEVTSDMFMGGLMCE